MACKVFLLSKMSIFIQNIKVYCVNSNFLSKSSIYKLQVDETMMIVTKKLNKHICQDLQFLSCCLHTQCHFQQNSYSKSSQRRCTNNRRN